jgi:hypothetical protein
MPGLGQLHLLSRCMIDKLDGGLKLSDTFNQAGSVGKKLFKLNMQEGQLHKFEKQFDEWNIRTAYMGETMNARTGAVTSAKQVYD